MTAYDKRPTPDYLRIAPAMCPHCAGKGVVSCDPTHPARIWYGARTVRPCDCCKPIVETRNAETRS